MGRLEVPFSTTSTYFKGYFNLEEVMKSGSL